MLYMKAVFIRSANVDALLAPEYTSVAKLGVSRKHNAVTPRNNPPLPSEYMDARKGSGEKLSRSSDR
jgi:hypothetical protein